MNPHRLQTFGTLLCCTVFIGACDQPLLPGSTESAAGPLTASDASCALSLRQFAPSLRQLTGSRIGVPYDRVDIDGSGRLLWNSVGVEPRTFEEYLQSASAPPTPVLLVIRPAPNAPCAAARRALIAAVQAGRCKPERCAFERPGSETPPPPVTEQAKSRR